MKQQLVMYLGKVLKSAAKYPKVQSWAYLCAGKIAGQGDGTIFREELVAC